MCLARLAARCRETVEPRYAVHVEMVVHERPRVRPSALGDPRAPVPRRARLCNIRDKINKYELFWPHHALHDGRSKMFKRFRFCYIKGESARCLAQKLPWSDFAVGASSVSTLLHALLLTSLLGHQRRKNSVLRTIDVSFRRRLCVVRGTHESPRLLHCDYLVCIQPFVPRKRKKVTRPVSTGSLSVSTGSLPVFIGSLPVFTDITQVLAVHPSRLREVPGFQKIGNLRTSH